MAKQKTNPISILTVIILVGLASLVLYQQYELNVISEQAQTLTAMVPARSLPMDKIDNFTPFPEDIQGSVP